MKQLEPVITGYTIPSDKIEKKVRVASLTDFHDIFSNDENAQDIIDSVKKLNPDYILIVGDTMQGAKYDNKPSIVSRVKSFFTGKKVETSYEKLSSFLDKLGTVAPVVITLGNHDLVGMSEYGRENFRKLSNIKNVYALDNKSMEFDGVRITGFSPERAAYKPGNHESGKGAENFVIDWKKANLRVSTDSKSLELLAVHPPHPVANPYVGRYATGIREFDCSYAGHLHNGYYSLKKEAKHKLREEDFGYWEMFSKIKNYSPVISDEKGKVRIKLPGYERIDLCRGMHMIGEEGRTSAEYADPIKSSDFNEENFGNQNHSLKIHYNPQNHGGSPLIISRGVNRLFGLPNHPEITFTDFVPNKGKGLVKAA